MEYYVYTYLDPRKPARFGFEHEPFYVGKGKGARDREHVRLVETDRSNLHKSNRIKAILRDGMSPIIVRNCHDLDEETALSFEIKLIKSIGRADLGDGPLLNLTDGGDGCSNMSSHGREVLSEKMRGERNPNYGGKLSRGRARPDNIGRKHTEQTKKKLSQIRRNDSSSTKAKRCESFKKTWKERHQQWCHTYILIDPSGNEHTVNDGLDRFLSEHGLNQPIISRMIREPAYRPSKGACVGWQVFKK